VLIYLDSNIVIYAVEQPPGWGARAAARLAVLHTSSDHPVVSDLTRLECRVGPLISSDAAILARFDAFFAAPGIQVIGLSAAVCDRAALIRARYRFRLADAMNLAAAVESGCSVFLTHDLRLSHFPDLVVEVLP
jgi:predicted nucleic acid-binding protein